MKTEEFKRKVTKTFGDERNIINIAAGSTMYAPIFAIPITEKEALNIKTTARLDKKYGELDVKAMVAVGKTKSPSKRVLEFLPYIMLKDFGKFKDEELIRSYYYPPLGRPSEAKDNVIVFEDSRSLWNYYATSLTLRRQFNNVLIIKS